MTRFFLHSFVAVALTVPVDAMAAEPDPVDWGESIAISAGELEPICGTTAVKNDIGLANLCEIMSHSIKACEGLGREYGYGPVCEAADRVRMNFWRALERVSDAISESIGVNVD